MAGRRAVMRLLFVALVAAGIAGMHTLGHPTSGGHGAAAHSSAPPAHESPMAHLAGDAITATASAGQVMLHGTDLSLDPSTVCLAILAAFAVGALLAALVIGGRRMPPPLRHPHGVIAIAGRGPPASRPIGLRLADLSVLRT